MVGSRGMDEPRRTRLLAAVGLWVATMVLVVPASAAAAAVAVPPRPPGYVTDRAGVVPDDRARALNERLAQFERDTSNQILVYVDRKVPDGTTLEEFANAAFNAWGVGQKGKDNGVVLFVFVDDRKMRFEVGYGLEGAIPDARTVQIRESALVPRLRQGDYAGGLEATADELMKAARGDPFQGTGQTAAETTPSGPLPWWTWLLPVVILAAAGAAARTGAGLESRLTRGGFTGVFATAFVMMAGTILAQDARILALGFGAILLVMAVAVAVMIARGTSLTGRRRVGLGILQVSAGLVIGAFGIFCFAALRESLAGLGGLALLGGFPGLVVGGIVYSQDPLRLLTVFAGRMAFLILLISALFLAAILFVQTTGAGTALDWTVVSGLVWLMTWIFARSRGWKLLPKIEFSSSYSGSGRSSGWSSSSGSSSWSSSSSGSSFSGGGGRSGGGGSSGSW